MAPAVPDDVMDELKARYAEPHRAYHGWPHIADLLQQFAANKPVIRRPLAFELAVLFHDAVYDPRSSTNEADSAALLALRMQAHTPLEELLCAHDLIMATHQHMLAAVRPEFADDARLFLDMDLSILGADQQRFDAYDAAIRQEYSFVPIETYRERRRAVLRRFLDRPRLFLTEAYRERLEASARANLQRAIAGLG
jgi:predicted metal-dependent HD superfamily phosphohydrolase